MKRRRLKNTASARTMRRAVAYARLAAKAERNGEPAAHYWTQEARLRSQAERERAREESRRSFDPTKGGPA